MAEYSLIWAEPRWLWGLLPLAALMIGASLAGARLRRVRLQRLCGPGQRWLRSMPTPPGRWRTAAVVLATLLLLLVLARPQLGRHQMDSQRLSIDLLVALDLSRSMLADDRKPSRLEAAKNAVRAILDRDENLRLSILAFAGDARLVAPLTSDRSAIELILDHLNPDFLGRGGTSIDEAIELAARRAAAAPMATPTLILLSDGEELEGSAVLAARRAQIETGLRIYTVGVGTPAGALLSIPEYNADGALIRRKPLLDRFGRQVFSRMDEPTLRHIASASGGFYAPLGDEGAGVDVVIDRVVQTAVKTQRMERIEQRYDLFQIPLGLAILLWTAALMPAFRTGHSPAPKVDRAAPGRTPVRVRPAGRVGVVGALSFFLAVPAYADIDPSHVRAQKLLQAGQPTAAMAALEAGLLAAPDDPYLLYNYAVAAAAAGDAADAEAGFSRLSMGDVPARLKARARFQLGNLDFVDAYRLEQADVADHAILRYEQAREWYALAAHQDDAKDVQHNRQVADTRLRALYQQRAAQRLDVAEKAVAKVTHPPSLERALTQTQGALQDLSSAKALRPDDAQPRIESQVQRARQVQRDAMLGLARYWNDDTIGRQPDQGSGTPLSRATQALDWYNQVLTNDPDYSPAVQERAALMQRMKDMYEREGDAHYELALSHLEKGTGLVLKNFEKAADDYRAALDMAPQDEGVQQKLDALTSRLVEQYQSNAERDIDKGEEAMTWNTPMAVRRLEAAHHALGAAEALVPNDRRTAALRARAELGLAAAYKQRAEESRVQARQAQAKGAERSLERAAGLLERAVNDYRLAGHLNPKLDVTQAYGETLSELFDVRSRLTDVLQAAADAKAVGEFGETDLQVGADPQDLQLMNFSRGSNFNTRPDPPLKDW